MAINYFMPRERGPWFAARNNKGAIIVAQGHEGAKPRHWAGEPGMASWHTGLPAGFSHEDILEWVPSTYGGHPLDAAETR